MSLSHGGRGPVFVRVAMATDTVMAGPEAQVAAVLVARAGAQAEAVAAVATRSSEPTRARAF